MYPQWDSNPQALRQLILSQPCIPFHHEGLPVQAYKIVSMNEKRSWPVKREAERGTAVTRRHPGLWAYHWPGIRVAATPPRLTLLLGARLRGCGLDEGRARVFEVVQLQGVAGEEQRNHPVA